MFPVGSRFGGLLSYFHSTPPRKRVDSKQTPEQRRLYSSRANGASNTHPDLERTSESVSSDLSRITSFEDTEGRENTS